MSLKGDFHMHTTASDGKLSSSELVDLANSKNINIIAITDHDTIDGIDEGIKCGKKKNITVIPGIELSTTYNDESIHILGYFNGENYKSSEFKSFLSDMKNKRYFRAKKMIEKINEIHGFHLHFKEISSSAKGVIARPHIAKAIIEEKPKLSWEYVFNNIIGNGCPAYIPSVKLPLEEGIKLLKNQDAIVVLAHPTFIKKSSVETLLQFDFDGIEALYPKNNSGEYEKFKSLAEKYNLFITAGSDFHGDTSIDTKHDDMGSVTLEGSDLMNFLNKLNV